MNRNGMVAFSVLEKLRDELLEYDLEIRHIDGPMLMLVSRKNTDVSHQVVHLGSREDDCATIIARSIYVKLLLRTYGTTHDEKKEIIVWILAHAAIAFAKIHNTALFGQTIPRIEFLRRYAEETAKELALTIPCQPLHAAFACYLIESHSWL